MITKWLLAILLLTSSALASAAELSAADREAIERTVQRYVNGFRTRSFADIQATTSPSFRTATGGDAAWRERLARQDVDYQRFHRAFEVQVVAEVHRVLVNFNVQDSAGKTVQNSSNDHWFAVVRGSSGWVLDLIIHDYTPE